MTHRPILCRRGPLWLTLLFYPLLALAGADQDFVGTMTERVRWTKTPIPVTLTVGEERLVHFADSVSVGLPQALAPLLRSQSINGTLYLLAQAPFEATRVMVRSVNEGPLYVLDVSAQLPDSETPQRPAMEILAAKPAPDEQAADHTPLPTMRWGYVALTRYAAQQLYAPARLLVSIPGIVRIPVNPAPVDLIRGGQVEAIPVAAWRSGGHTVTALTLRNTSQEPVVLDPRELRGPWLTATFQHNRLLPAGTDADTTAVYLISARSFAAAF